MRITTVTACRLAQHSQYAQYVSRMRHVRSGKAFTPQNAAFTTVWLADANRTVGSLKNFGYARPYAATPPAAEHFPSLHLHPEFCSNGMFWYMYSKCLSDRTAHAEFVVRHLNEPTDQHACRLRYTRAVLNPGPTYQQLPTCVKANQSCATRAAYGFVAGTLSAPHAFLAHPCSVFRTLHLFTRHRQRWLW